MWSGARKIDFFPSSSFSPHYSLPLSVHPPVGWPERSPQTPETWVCSGRPRRSCRLGPQVTCLEKRLKQPCGHLLAGESGGSPGPAPRWLRQASSAAGGFVCDSWLLSATTHAPWGHQLAHARTHLFTQHAVIESGG